MCMCAYAYIHVYNDTYDTCILIYKYIIYARIHTHIYNVYLLFTNTYPY